MRPLLPLGRFLLPGLVAVVWLSTSAEPRGARWRRIALALGIAAALLGVHAAALLATAEPSPDRLFAALTGRPPAGWVRWLGTLSKPSTAYVFATLPHLKYLANAVVLTAPAALPLLLGFAIVRRGRVLRTPAAIFLATAKGGTHAAALSTRHAGRDSNSDRANAGRGGSAGAGGRQDHHRDGRR